jgi:hypothetical protein
MKCDHRWEEIPHEVKPKRGRRVRCETCKIKGTLSPRTWTVTIDVPPSTPPGAKT